MLCVPLSVDANWRYLAECRDRSLSLFFPVTKRAEQAGKKICQRCPVQEQCFAVAEPYGTWGGTTRKDRARISRKVREQRAA